MQKNYCYVKSKLKIAPAYSVLHDENKFLFSSSLLNTFGKALLKKIQ